MLKAIAKIFGCLLTSDLSEDKDFLLSHHCFIVDGCIFGNSPIQT